MIDKYLGRIQIDLMQMQIIAFVIVFWIEEITVVITTLQHQTKNNRLIRI